MVTELVQILLLLVWEERHTEIENKCLEMFITIQHCCDIQVQSQLSHLPGSIHTRLGVLKLICGTLLQYVTF